MSAIARNRRAWPPRNFHSFSLPATEQFCPLLAVCSSHHIRFFVEFLLPLASHPLLSFCHFCCSPFQFTTSCFFVSHGWSKSYSKCPCYNFPILSFEYTGLTRLIQHSYGLSSQACKPAELWEHAAKKERAWYAAKIVLLPALSWKLSARGAIDFAMICFQSSRSNKPNRSRR